MSLRERILRELRGGPVAGQTALMDRVLGPERSLLDCEDFRHTVNYLISNPCDIVEERVQLPGTGVEALPAFEFRYRLATEAERAASRAKRDAMIQIEDGGD